MSFGQGLPKLHPFGLSPTDYQSKTSVVSTVTVYTDPRTLAPLVRLSGTYQGSGIRPEYTLANSGH